MAAHGLRDVPVNDVLARQTGDVWARAAYHLSLDQRGTIAVLRQRPSEVLARFAAANDQNVIVFSRGHRLLPGRALVWHHRRLGSAWHVRLAKCDTIDLTDPRTCEPVCVGAAAMARRNEFRILLAVDGSAHARAALAAVLRGPWPEGSRLRAVSARQMRGPHQRSIVLTSLDRRADDAADQARRALARRWPDAEAVVVNSAPINGILAEATKFRADMIGVGWRGYGPVRRLLMGSVSLSLIHI